MTAVLGLAALLVFALLAVSVVAVIGVIVPVPWLGLRTRGRSALVAVGSVVVAALLGAAIAVIAPADRRSQSAAEPPQVSAAAGAAPVAAPAPATDPITDLRSRLVRDVSSHKVTVEQPGEGARIAVRFDLSEEPTTGLTKYAAMRDVARIMRAADESPVDFNSLFIAGTATLVDVYGRESRDRVIRATYQRDALSKINWDNFLDQNVARVADSFELSPAYR